MTGGSQWLLVPMYFVLVLFGAVTLFSIPEALDHTRNAYGVGYLVGYYLLLAWHCLWRGAVALAVTVPLAISGGNLERKHIVWLATAAALSVLAADYTLDAVARSKVGYFPHLAVTAVAYSITLLVGRYVIDRGHEHAV
jgi:hypothetical protein